MVVESPPWFAALATAVPIEWNSDPGFDVAMPTFCAKAAVLALIDRVNPAKAPKSLGVKKCFNSSSLSSDVFLFV